VLQSKSVLCLLLEYNSATQMSSISLNAVNSEDSVLSSGNYMTSKSRTAPQWASSYSTSNAIVHSEIPAFNGFIKRAAKRQLIVSWMGYYSRDRLLMTLKCVSNCLGINIYYLYGVIV
jgi:hypothetical protein